MFFLSPGTLLTLPIDRSRSQLLRTLCLASLQFIQRPERPLLCAFLVISFNFDFRPVRHLTSTIDRARSQLSGTFSCGFMAVLIAFETTGLICLGSRSEFVKSGNEFVFWHWFRRKYLPDSSTKRISGTLPSLPLKSNFFAEPDIVACIPLPEACCWSDNWTNETVDPVGGIDTCFEKKMDIWFVLVPTVRSAMP